MIRVHTFYFTISNHNITDTGLVKRATLVKEMGEQGLRIGQRITDTAMVFVPCDVGKIPLMEWIRFGKFCACFNVNLIPKRAAKCDSGQIRVQCRLTVISVAIIIRVDEPRGPRPLGQCHMLIIAVAQQIAHFLRKLADMLFCAKGEIIHQKW